MAGIQFLPVYTTVTCQTISPDGLLYAASTEAGGISAALIEDILCSSGKAKDVKICSFYGINKEPVYSLTSTNEFLYAGGRGQIRGWRWKNLIESGETEPTFIIPVGAPASRVRINWLDVDEQDSGGGCNIIIAGCGDSNIYTYNIETRQLKYTLSGHTSFVHCVAAAHSAGVSIVSAGEDGAVKLWDTR